jgi:predicted transcriptional regulator
MKITFLQIEQAFIRACNGESVMSIARSLDVTEGCLRFHFRKSTSPKEIRHLAYEMFHAQQLYSSLAIREKTEVGRRLKRELVREPSCWLTAVIETKSA